MTDPLRLAFTPDLSVAGVTASLHAVHRLYMHLDDTEIIREIAAGTAAELAFRRYLHNSQAPFENRESLLAGTGPAELLLGGRPVQMFTCLVSRRTAIQQLLRKPGALTRSTVIMPQTTLPDEKSTLYVFAFVLGLVANRQVEQARLDAAGLPAAWVWILPERWRRRTSSTPLGAIILKSSSDQPGQFDLGGTDSSGTLREESMELLPHTRYQTRQSYHSAGYLRCSRAPRGRLGLYSPVLKETLVSSISDWKNIWIYGMQIIIAGFVTAGAFMDHAKLVPVGSDFFPQPTTRLPGYALPVDQLGSIQKLLESIKTWKPSNISL